WRTRGDFHIAEGDYARALADYQHVFKLDADGVGYAALSFFWSTCPDAKYRDGKKALEYALKDCAVYKRNNHIELSTRAAAHAELGDFEAARKWQSQAVEIAPAYERVRLEAQLALY